MNSSDHHLYYSSFDNIDLNLNVVVDQLPLICSKTVIADHEAPPPQLSHGAGEGFYFEESNNFSNHEEAKIYVCDGESRQNQAVMKSENHDKGLIKLSPPKREDHKNETQREKLCTSVKWVSSKMKIMKKITNPDADSLETSIQKFEDQKGLSSSPLQTINNYKNSNNSSINCNNTIRVCSDCYTTKTPLWRSGPRGPKSLCNACGIRQRKVRRAMAAAAAAETTIGGPFCRSAAYAPTAKTKVQHKEIKKTNNYNKNSHLPLKKRCKFREQGRGQKRFGFEDLTVILSKNSTYQQVFHQDEKEAATLLMALSYGLVHG